MAKCEPLPTPTPSTVTHKQIDARLDKFAEGIGEALGAHLRELKQRLVELEQRQLKLGGTYKSGVTYDENTLVSFQGGLWLSRSTTTARPGSGSPAWRLAVKRGDAE